MTTPMHARSAQSLTLKARTAADLMVPNPVSVRASATVPEAVALLTDKGFGAAPVIDEAGRPIGVLSRADIITHDREKGDHPAPVHHFYDDHAGSRQTGSTVADTSETRVRDLMTPVVFSVAPTTSAAKTVQEMVGLKVHRLFVVDSSGVLVGVISALDVLRRLE